MAKANDVLTIEVQYKARPLLTVSWRSYRGKPSGLPLMKRLDRAVARGMCFLMDNDISYLWRRRFFWPRYLGEGRRAFDFGSYALIVECWWINRRT
jgi:hypothetical protein